MDSGERGLQAGRAHRRLLEGDLLLVARVRSVVGGDAVHDARAQALDQRLPVGLGAQRRVHLHARVQAADRVLGEDQVVRRGLAGDLHAALLGRRDDLHRLGAGQVLDVDAPALVAGQRAVARDHGRLAHAGDPGDAEQRADLALVHGPAPAERRVLLVQRQQRAGQALVLQRLAHHPGRDDRLAVVGEGDGALVAQLGHLGELLAAQSLRDRGGEGHGHARVAHGGVAQGPQHGRAVDHRIGVGHGHHRAEAAGGRGAGPGLEVLLVLLAGHAQVHVGVDEGRQDVAAGAVDDLRALGHVGAARRRQLDQPPVEDDEVEGAVDPHAGVEDVDAAQDEARGCEGGPDERHAGAGSGSGWPTRAVGCAVITS
jgi:hypothetical protein